MTWMPLVAGVLMLAGCQQAYRPAVPPSGFAEEPVNFGSPACQEAAALGPEKAVTLDEMLRVFRPLARPKGEFETTQQHKEMHYPAVKKINDLSRERSGQDRILLAFPIPEHRMSYNADQRVMNIGDTSGLLTAGQGMGSDNKLANYIFVNYVTEKESHYRAANAFGVERIVKKTERKGIGVVVPGGTKYSWPEMYYAGPYKRKEVVMDEQEARSAKSHTYVILAGNVEYPYYVETKDYVRPDIKYPMDVTKIFENIKFMPECAIVFNAALRKSYGPLNYKRSW